MLSAILSYVNHVIKTVDGIVWGPVMLVLLIGTGIFLTVRTGCFQFRRFGYMLKNTIFGLFSKNQHEKDSSGVSPFQAVATAMAGTIGTGSIAGLATAIVSGGPGAIFWMWISALLGMVTKYSEIVLSLKYREKNEKGEWVGGPMYYIKNGLGIKWLAALFAVFAMIACLGTGNATQSNSIAVALDSTLGVAPWITGLVLVVIAAAVILGGMRRISSVNEKLVPFMAVFFVVCAVLALILNIQAVATAMAGTIGTGSIAGLATAIVSGGPGAIFWMWISALLGMVTKYSEIVLSLKYREKNEKGEWVGGPMYYIKNGLGIKWLAALFAVFAMIACLGTGNATQSNSIAVALDSTLGVAPWITGLVLVVIAAAVILGGMRRISSVNEKLVPFMAVFFVVCAVLALILNIRAVPAAFALIFKEAFNFKAAFGGAAGYGIMVAMQFGFSRGVFSNEAGLGSAPMAHAASSTKDPVKQGLWGMFEVFFTTIIICTLSGLIILTSGLWNGEGLEGAALSIASFDKILPGVGKYGITLATVMFALSTLLGWAYYGEVSIGYLTNKSKTAILIYRIVYVAVAFIGTVSSLDTIWTFSSAMNGLMAIPNLIGLIGLSKVIVSVTKEHEMNHKKIK